MRIRAFVALSCVVAVAAQSWADDSSNSPADGARFIAFHGYDHAIELTLGDTRAVLCPQVGGRVLEFSVNGRDALYLDEAEKAWRAGQPTFASAGRFDFGPELTITPHRELWTGEWTAEITGDHAARLTSPSHAASGVRLTRDFRLVPTRRDDDSSAPAVVRLDCAQTIENISDHVIEACHWGRSFSPAGGICLVPLGDRPSRYPGKYAMYEDRGVINVNPTDSSIRLRDGFAEIVVPPRKPKLGFDSHAGWLAYLRPNDTLFVKRFPTFPNRPYGEAAALTISVWSPVGAPNIELEPIGPLERLRPGEKASFTESWYLLDHDFPAAGMNVDLKALEAKVATLTAPAVTDQSRAVDRNSPKRVAIIVGPSNHPPGTHEVAAGARLIAHCLENATNVHGIEATIHEGWPTDPRALDDVATVIFSGDRFPPAELPDGERIMRELSAAMDRGCGIVCFHYATGLAAEDVAADGDHPLLRWMGGYFATRCEHHQSIAKLFTATIEPAKVEHPVLRGWRAFTLDDEPYINNYFGKDGPAANVTSLATAMLPPEAPKQEIVAWAAERPDGGRGVGVVMPHYYRNWRVDDLRRLIMNAIMWTAHVDVPTYGVDTPTPDLAAFHPASIEPQPRAARAK